MDKDCQDKKNRLQGADLSFQINHRKSENFLYPVPPVHLCLNSLSVKVTIVTRNAPGEQNVFHTHAATNVMHQQEILLVVRKLTRVFL
jgi:hypothetical protein